MNEPANLTCISVQEKSLGALLGAAVGDALGWPLEDRSQRVGGRASMPTEFTHFVAWKRRCGGRYIPHIEEMRAGEYSDDTQLIQCVARSLLRGNDWWSHFVRVELPFWTTYERGGGIAIKRSATHWMSGKAPWEKSDDDRTQYFQAGANGVAMRILPHCITNASTSNFEQLRRDVILNGIATHGHPRALIGALAYAYGAWFTFALQRKLEYGELLDKVFANINTWSEFELPEFEWKNSWIRASQDVRGKDYKSIWAEATNEFADLLVKCRSELEQGALEIDGDVLRALGCFGPYKGSGTVTSASALFLASRHAANPVRGLMAAASCENADTDTLTSMTAGLLGAVSGTEWLNSYRDQLQDSSYFKHLSSMLLSTRLTKSSPIESIGKSDLARFAKNLQSENCKEFRLPDSRTAKLIGKEILDSRMTTNSATAWRLQTEDGQTLIFKYIRKISKIEVRPRQLRNSAIDRIGLKIWVQALENARNLYVVGLGLEVERELNDSIAIRGGIYLLQQPTLFESKRTSNNTNTRICIRVSEPLPVVYSRVEIMKFHIVTRITHREGEYYFRCFDNEGNLIEVFQDPPPSE